MLGFSAYTYEDQIMSLTNNSMRRTIFRLPLYGFTLIEILVVIGMIAILSSIVLTAINPLRQFAQARNAQRESDVNALLNAVGERIAENRGVFVDATACITPLPSTPTTIANLTGSYDIRPCLVPAFISELPVDPLTGNNACTTSTCTGQQYKTGYTIAQDSSTGRITVCAPGAAESAITGSIPYCLTR
jgi:prepilin-type N-terminal cleavage/methylation domain-containing protein